jgi:DNA invertase Pin-like site-specific DNA recombinase
MRIGYVRVSTTDQNLSLQRDALTAAGCERIFVDEGIGRATTTRPGLDQALGQLSRGDTLIVWKLDRLGRSLAHVVQMIAELGASGIDFRSLSDPIDTAAADGHHVLHIVSVFAEYERSLIAERTTAGLSAAKRRGQKLGRKPSLSPAQAELARRLIESGESPRAVARTLKVGKSTLYRHLPGAHGAGGSATL